jgi:biotin synthase-like enzyme
MKASQPRGGEPKAPVNEVVRGWREVEMETIPNKIKEVQEILKAAYKMNEAGTLGDASEKATKILEELRLEMDKLNTMLNEYEKVIHGREDKSIE